MYTKPDIPFKGTKAQEVELKEFIDTEKSQPGALMPVLQKAQEIYGYRSVRYTALQHSIRSFH